MDTGSTNSPLNSDVDACLYLDMQNRLFEALHFLSCHEDNFNAYSIRLSALLLEAGSFVDSLSQSFIRWRYEAGKPFQSAAGISSFTEKLEGTKNFTASDYRCLFEREFAFSSRTINLNAYSDRFFVMHTDTFPPRGSDYPIVPFAEWAQDRSPEWWAAFTDLKHDRTKNIRCATLKNVLFSFGGAFLVFVFYHQRFVCTNVDPVFFRLFTPLFFKAQSAQSVMRRYYKIE